MTVTDNARAGALARHVPKLADLVDLFRRGLWLPDPGVVYVTLGAVAANMLPGDPTWLLIIAPPSSGKSETLHAVSKLPDHYTVDGLTEAGLLSGTVSRDGSGTGGVLRLVGDRGSLVASDFSTFLGAHSEARATIFAALRRVADGFYTRRLGTAGGTTFEWEGHCGFLGATTEAIDAPDVSMGLLGERFAYYRMPAATPEDDLMACSLAAEMAGQETELRRERADAVAAFFADLVLPDEMPPLTDAEYDRLSTLATIGVRLRTPTIRDGRTRELVLVPQNERPMRLLKVLRHLFAGLTVIGTPPHEAWRLIAEVALGGTHPGRRAVVDFLIGEGRAHASPMIAARTLVPKTSAQRHLEDLAAHGTLDVIGDAPQLWQVADWLRKAWWAVTDPAGAPAQVTPAAPAPVAPDDDEAPAWTREDF